MPIISGTTICGITGKSISPADFTADLAVFAWVLALSSSVEGDFVQAQTSNAIPSTMNLLIEDMNNHPTYMLTVFCF
ncbi:MULTISPECIES: hypothetical protein [unclassified Acinetobacter]|uniref:hypothetical protein n=1 Tax=unclassified Acinetobacter TaxID=196816 RepID=UPI0003AAA71E|nr:MULTISPECIES: hypothetical protein [unclassified Acinetobacter]